MKWNASGVDQSRDFSHSSTTFWGQQIDPVKVTSDSDKTDVVLVILENDQRI
ncbi:MAG: hypothetical protein SFU53_00645 [Terrimicrobiaceae bacterium]|nr:hypothetical protein [Terrimicrobiaceae bacterium]